MPTDTPVISTSERVVTDERGAARVLHDWQITRAGRVTEVGSGSDTHLAALEQAIAVAEGRAA